MSDDARFDPRFDPAFQPGFEGILASQAPVQPTAAPHLTVPPAVLPAAVSASPVDSEKDPAGINPFVVVLGVVALVLVGGGLFLGSRLQVIFASANNGSTFDYATAQLLISAAPLMTALGIATAIGVLFLLAARWGRR